MGIPLTRDDGSVSAAVLLLRDCGAGRAPSNGIWSMPRGLKPLPTLYIGITHDIKVPLHAVIMHLEMLRKVVDGESRGGEEKEGGPLYRQHRPGNQATGDHHSGLSGLCLTV